MESAESEAEVLARIGMLILSLSKFQRVSSLLQPELELRTSYSFFALYS